MNKNKLEIFKILSDIDNFYEVIGFTIMVSQENLSS